MIKKPEPPSVSIVIPTYNRAAYIAESIESAISQSIQATEIIVIDDGSEDDTLRIVEGYEGTGVRTVRIEHGGVSRARNRGLAEAAGDYVLTLASDDVMLHNCLESHLAAFRKNPGLDLYYGDLVATSADLVPFMKVRYPQYLGSENRLKSILAVTNQIGDPFAMVRRQWAIEMGGYAESLPRCEDWDLWTRGLGRMRLKHIGAEMGYWRWHGSNLTTGQRDDAQLLVDRTIRERVLGAASDDSHVSNLGWAALARRQPNSKIFVWGAGEYGLAVLTLLERMGLLVAGFIDSSQEKQGSALRGLTVFPPEILDTSVFRPIVVVASVYEGEIARSLEQKGLEEGIGYFRIRGMEYIRC